MGVDEQHEGFTVKRRGVIGSARANFACASKTCATKKGARVYELPTATTRCPVCGSRKLQRLMSAPGVSRGIAKAADALVGPEYLRQKAKKDRAKEQQRETPMLAVKNDGNIASAVSRALGMPVAGSLGQPGTSRPTLGITAPDLAGIKGAGVAYGPRPDPASVRRWRPEPGEIAAAKKMEGA